MGNIIPWAATVSTNRAVDARPEPPFQGRGLGAALLTHTLKQCDEGGHVAYLESGNPRNLSLYERHGFEAIGEIRIGECPAIYPMVRPAR